MSGSGWVEDSAERWTLTCAHGRVCGELRMGTNAWAKAPTTVLNSNTFVENIVTDISKESFTVKLKTAQNTGRYDKIQQ